MAEITIQFRTDEETKAKLIELGEKFERDMTKEILFLIKREYEQVFGSMKRKQESRVTGVRS